MLPRKVSNKKPLAISSKLLASNFFFQIILSHYLNDYTRGQNTTLSNDDVISTLNGLIETCKDGQKGFKHAAEGIKDSDLKTKFYEFGQQRAQFAGELQTLLRELGGEPEFSSSFSGAIPRGWIDIKLAVMRQDEATILNEAERGEDVAKNSYQKALEQNLPANVASVVRSQFASIQNAHDQVRTMRDAANMKTSAHTSR
jgi:uncharacterized protein (TIGR02284 family)